MLTRSLALSTALALALALAPGVVFGAPKARADDPRVTLTYIADVAGCPTRDQFSDQVAARLGARPFVDRAERSITVHILQDGSLIRGRILRGNGPPRELAATECVELVGMMAAILAVELEPSQPDVPVAGGIDPGAALVPQPAFVPTEMLVRIESARPDADLALHRASSGGVSRGRFGPHAMAFDSRAWERLCDAPCELRLESGAHHFAISRGLETALPQPSLIRIDRPSVIRLDLVDRGQERLAGGLVLGLGIPAGIGLALGSIWVDYQFSPGAGAVLLGSGGAVFVASMIVGIFFAARRDIEMLDVLPLALTDQGLALRF